MHVIKRITYFFSVLRARDHPRCETDMMDFAANIVLSQNLNKCVGFDDEYIINAPSCHEKERRVNDTKLRVQHNSG